MDIKMMLTALPGHSSGKPESGGETEGHFALALAQAGKSAGDTAGSQHQPLAHGASRDQRHPLATADTPLSTHSTTGEALTALGVSPQDLADNGQPLGEILERLALIDGMQYRALGGAVTTTSPEGSAEGSLALAEERLTRDAATEAGAALELADELSPEAQAALAMAALSNADTTRRGIDDAAQGLPGSLTSARAAGGSLLPAGQPIADDASRHADFMARLETRGPIANAQPASGGLENRVATDLALTPVSTDSRALLSDGARPGSVSQDPPNPLMVQSGTQATAAGSGQPAPTQASLPSPVQSQGWPGQLGQQLVLFARQGGEQQIEMRLNPAELGPLSVTLKMTEQGAQAQFLSAHAQVRQVLEQAIPQLREMLAEQGISLSDTSVGEQRQQDSQAFAGQDGKGGNGTGPGSTADEALADAGAPGSADTATDLTLDGRVNLYA